MAPGGSCLQQTSRHFPPPRPPGSEKPGGGRCFLRAGDRSALSRVSNVRDSVFGTSYRVPGVPRSGDGDRRDEDVRLPDPRGTSSSEANEAGEPEGTGRLQGALEVG